MKIDYNDRQVEAYALVMKKEYAEMERLFKKGIYSTGQKNIKGNYSNI